MARYIIMWEVDESRIPVDPAERKAAWLGAVEMAKQEIKDGLVKYWGGFLGQTKGFDIIEGTEDQVLSTTLKYIPYFRFNVIPLISIEKLEEALKAM